MTETILVKEFWHKEPILQCHECGGNHESLWSSVKFSEWLCRECFEVRMKEVVNDNV